jgi:predicted double-glycine peptidase
MNVILNVVTNFGGKSLKPGNEINVPLNVAQRWITRGIAHPVKEEVKPIEKVIEKPEENKKVFDNEFYGLNQEKEPEEVIFREPEIKSEVIKKAKKDKNKTK